jgi:hypothetical protein
MARLAVMQRARHETNAASSQIPATIRTITTIEHSRDFSFEATRSGTSCYRFGFVMENNKPMSKDVK